MKKQEEDIALAQAVGKLIAKRRQERSWTQNQLAEKMGVGYEAVSRMERGAILPNISKIKQLAEVFNCPIDELLFESSNRPTEQAQVIFRMIEGLSEQERAFVVDIVDRLSSQLKRQ
ncbi:helix-turn-helix domain-containing protein [Paraburkholderia aromaticivorans]|uniref:helix-turn-helix domain-containing protein n=1 Tax=Paraburkholderia aromaticivorans TaxID=2026199 RepID=UPI0038BE0F00